MFKLTSSSSWICVDRSQNYIFVATVNLNGSFCLQKPITSSTDHLFIEWSSSLDHVWRWRSGIKEAKLSNWGHSRYSNWPGNSFCRVVFLWNLWKKAKDNKIWTRKAMERRWSCNVSGRGKEISFIRLELPALC